MHLFLLVFPIHLTSTNVVWIYVFETSINYHRNGSNSFIVVRTIPKERWSSSAQNSGEQSLSLRLPFSLQPLCKLYIDLGSLQNVVSWQECDFCEYWDFVWIILVNIPFGPQIQDRSWRQRQIWSSLHNEWRIIYEQKWLFWWGKAYSGPSSIVHKGRNTRNTR